MLFGKVLEHQLGLSLRDQIESWLSGRVLHL
jgi:hypothetical protein